MSSQDERKLAEKLVSGVIVDLMELAPGFEKLVNRLSKEDRWSVILDGVTEQTEERIHSAIQQ